ncbi:MAG: hypothetical protein HYW85_06730 [Deltaproteobacteria bacterium]|nr:hypothetical protein [Deltaproteobacteria bacterium]
MKKRILFFTFLATLTLFQNLLFSYEYPVPQDEDMIILVLNRPQMEALYSRQNYSIAESPRGVCYGLDRINTTLLTKVQFQPGEKDSEDTIVLKLLMAFLGMPQIISGYNDLRDFTKKMDKEWQIENNPLKKAIEIIQLSQDRLDIANQVLYRRNLIFKQSEQVVVRTEAQTFAKYISKGVPLHVGIYNLNFGAHALTIVGLKQNILYDVPLSQFYVLDSNHPNQLQILSINENGQWTYAPWRIFNAQNVSLMWKEPSDLEIQAAQATLRPQFILGKTANTLLTTILHGKRLGGPR